MVTPILQAVGRGYTSNTILRGIARRFPQYANFITAAQAAGYTSNAVLRQIDKRKNGKNEKIDEDSYLTEDEKVKKRDKKQKRNAALTLLGVIGTAGAVAAGAVGLATRNSAIRPNQILPAQNIGRGQRQGQTINVPNPGLPNYQKQLPNQQKRLSGPQQSNKLTQGINPNSPSPSPPSPYPNSQGPNVNIKASSQLSPINNTKDILKNVNLVKNLGLQNSFENILKNNEFDTETTAEIFRSLLPNIKVKNLETVEGGLEKLIDDYKEYLQNPQSLEENQNINEISSPQPIQEPQSLQNDIKSLNQEKIPEQQPISSINPINQKEIQSNISSPIEKSVAGNIKKQDLNKNALENQIIKPIDVDFKKIVITPSGAGELKKTGKNGIVASVNGKDKSFYPKDIQEVPESMKKVVSRILEIEEKDASSNVSLSIYDNKDKNLYVQYHSGETYKYYGVEPEIAMKIKNKEAIPISDGENDYAVWTTKDTESIGAAVDQFIKKNPKYAKNKKGQPPNPNYYKLETLFDHWIKLRDRKIKKL